MWPFDYFKKKREKEEQKRRREEENVRRQKIEEERIAKERERRLEENRRKEAQRKAAIEQEKVFKSFTFKSDCHQRYESGIPIQGLQECSRTVSVVKNTDGCPGYRLEPGVGYIVKIYNDDLGKPNMSDKPMRLVSKTADKVEFVGFPIEAQTPFGWQEVDYRDYGLTVYYSNGEVSKCVLHMFDRSIDLEYRSNSIITNSQTSNSTVIQIAAQLNMAHNMRDRVAGQLCVNLYEEVGPGKQGGEALICLSNSDCQCVGLAFTTMALCYDFGDEDINSVAAENAYYCLAKSLIEKNNTFVAPAIYTIMQKGGKLMKDKLISSWCDMAQKQVGMPIGIMLGGNPFTDPKLDDFRQQAINFKDYISYYALIKFYDVKQQQYLIPTDMPYYIPNESEIKSFLTIIKTNPSFLKDDFVADCEEHFVSVYEQCKKTLLKY